MEKKIKFVFDLDGTITKLETLPLIAKHFKVEEEISDLTKNTIKGNVPFVESFIKRVGILGNFNINDIDSLLKDIPIFDAILEFIQKNANNCVIATGNLDVWISALLNKIGCQAYSSIAKVSGNKVVGIKSILRKAQIVSDFQKQGYEVIYIGEGNNDVEAMRLADISIACGLVHNPANSVMAITDYVIYQEAALIRILEAIKSPINLPGQSLVISCAGIGSRLGLSCTKALIDFYERPLIQWQLQNFKDVEDIRVVVGFQSEEVIKAVREVRNDVIFRFNHDYFSTGTGKSLYLGSKFSNELIIAWDGDLVVHSEDISKCLEGDNEYLGISSPVSEDSVFVLLDNNGVNVIEFVREQKSEFEWSGPARLKAVRIEDNDNHVYSGLIKQLPLPALKIRAFDIDTPIDYGYAKNTFKDYQLNMSNDLIHSYYSRMAENIVDPLETRNKAPDFSKYDVEFMKSYINPNHYLMDAGAGTGLLLNHISKDFKSVLAIELFSQFSSFIKPLDHLKIINEDIRKFNTNLKFDLLIAFGLMNLFNKKEAKNIYEKFKKFLKPNGRLIIKNQMGRNETVVVNGYSEELKQPYYSEYRNLDLEKTLLENAGFVIEKVDDIYPEKFNRWENTWFKVIVARG